MTPLAEQIVTLRRTKHLAMAEIARRLGCSKARVSQVLTDHGLGEALRARMKPSKPVVIEPKITLRRFSWEMAE